MVAAVLVSKLGFPEVCLFGDASAARWERSSPWA